MGGSAEVVGGFWVLVGCGVMMGEPRTDGDSPTN